MRPTGILAVLVIVAVPALQAQDQAPAARIKFETKSLKKNDIEALRNSLSTLAQVEAVEVDDEDNEFALTLSGNPPGRGGSFLDLATVVNTLQAVSTQVGNSDLRLKNDKTVLRGTALLTLEGVGSAEQNDALLAALGEIDDLTTTAVTRPVRTTTSKDGQQEPPQVVLGSFSLVIQEGESVRVGEILDRVRGVNEDIRLANIVFGIVRSSGVIGK